MVREDGLALAALPVVKLATVPLWCTIAAAKSNDNFVRMVTLRENKSGHVS